MLDTPAFETRLAGLREARSRDLLFAERRERLWTRLGLFALGCAFLLLLVMGQAGGLPMAGAAALAGGALVVVCILARERATERRLHLEEAFRFHDSAIRARAGEVMTPSRNRPFEPDENHPFAQDLDVLAPGGLLSRIDRTETVIGQAALRALLLDPPMSGIPERQAAVRELASLPELRETLHLAMKRVSGLASRPRDLLAADAALDALSVRGVPPGAPRSALSRSVSWAWTLLGTLALALWATDLVPASVLGLAYALNFLWTASRKEAGAMEEALADLAPVLPGLSAFAATAAGAALESPFLREHQEALQRGDAASALDRLRRISDLLSARRNKFFQLTVGVLFALDDHLAEWAAAWGRRHNSDLGRWLSSIAALEAVLSVAFYGASVPKDAWPVAVEEGDILDAQALAHPLLPRDTRVGNDLRIGAAGDVWLVTGSNLSGKSTFLRSAGLALVLGRIGAPVPARSISFLPCRLFTCMRVTDDLLAGRSHFAAEVRRLRQGLDHARPGPPVLVLLDEILSGTNSRERHAGAVAVLKALASMKASVLVSTHDLELHESLVEAKVAHRVVHFRDHEEDGVMRFDYRLQEGLLPSTNALRVLKAAGIPVDA